MPASVLTPKQMRFVAEYLIDNNGTQAAIRAGYSEKTAVNQGSRLLTNPHVKRAVWKGNHRLMLNAEVTAAAVRAEMKKIGFANIDSFLDRTAGEAYVDFSDCSAEEMAAVSEITTEYYTEGNGDDAKTVKRVKFKMHNKEAALTNLARMEGAFKDSVVVSGKDGAPLFAPMTFVKMKPADG